MLFVSRNKALKNPVDCLNNQQGSALIIALIVMAVLSMVGLSAINTATVENTIVRNERIYQENFYLAESSVNEAAQKIEIETNGDNLVPRNSSWIWIHDVLDSSGNPVDFTEAGNWLHADSSNDNSEQAAVSDQAFYSTVNKGVRRGSSLDIGATRLYEYAVFGHGKSKNGSVIIEIGYLKRF
jgi:type II secretory pathway pseudopilin PulG